MISGICLSLITMEVFDYWKFLAGLGFFLFGMQELEAALEKLGGRAMKSFLRKSTQSPIRGIFTGVFSTAVLQSSSVVTLMLLAFVGAGIVSFQNSIGVILGANLGTTVTGWIVAVFGFSFKIQNFALPMVAVGTLGQVFLHSRENLRESFRLATGFGLLFFGLDLMKTGIEEFAAGIDITEYASYGNFVFMLVGLGFSALVQSSSATMVIALSLLNSGLIAFPAAGSLIIGANLGTTVTILIGSIGGGQSTKKKVALTHLSFNLITAAVAFPMLKLLTWIIIDLWDVDSPLYALTAFHTLFNGLGILLFLPIINPFAKWMDGIVTEKPHQVTRFIHKLQAREEEAGIAALKNELHHMLEGVFALIKRSLRIEIPTQVLPADESGKDWWPADESSLKTYENLIDLEIDLIHFFTGMQKLSLSHHYANNVESLMGALRNLSYSAKSVKDIRPNIQNLAESDNPEAQAIFSKIKATEIAMIKTIYEALQEEDRDRVISLLKETQERSKKFYNEFINLIYAEIKLDHINEKQVLDLIRVNRELYNTNKFLVRGLLSLKLSDGEIIEMPGSVEEML